MAVDQSTCGKCGSTFERARRGRPPKFCSACRARRYVPPRAHADITCPCGETFTGDPRRKYCSEPCRAAAIPPSVRGSCSLCGKPIRLSGSSASSPRCKDCPRQRAKSGRVPKCGASSGYKSGCRCEECREYKRRENESYAERRKAAGLRVHNKARIPRECSECGEAFQARADGVAAGKGSYCSVRCANRARNWARGFEPRPPRKSEFRRRAERLAAKAAAGTTGKGMIWVQGECIVCRDYFVSPGLASRYCSRACRDLNRSARSFGMSWLDRMDLFARDNWTCQICSEPVDYTADPYSDWYPSIDHIIPRSHGGSDDIENLRTAHRWCNSVRGDLRYYTDADLAA